VRGWRGRIEHDRARSALAAIACAAAALALPGCGGGGGVAPATAVVQGYVREMASDRAVQGAAVTIAAIGTTTDAQGRFRLAGVPTGTRAMIIAAAGYSVHTEVLSIAAGVTTLPDILLADSPPPPPVP
jgi:hypothetical protein